jgi:monothiol glutaredoxin
MNEQEIRQDIREHITQAIEGQRVMLFMKGTPDQPQCGFSARTVAMLDELGTDYAAMDILPHPLIRQELSELSGWPTIPQLFIGGELVGGCDIVTEMFESGELAQALGVEQSNGSAPAPAADAQPRPIQIGE